MKIKVTVKGTKELKRTLQRFGRNAPRMLARELFTEATMIMAKSAPLTPLEFGPLRASGRVERPRITSAGASIEFGYGGPAAPYALIVHEMPKTNNFTTPGTGPKYLERPLREAMRGMSGRMARRLRADFSLRSGSRNQFM